MNGITHHVYVRDEVWEIVYQDASDIPDCLLRFLVTALDEGKLTTRTRQQVRVGGLSIELSLTVLMTLTSVSLQRWSWAHCNRGWSGLQESQIVK